MRIRLATVLVATAACTVELPERAGPTAATGSPVTVDQTTGSLDVDGARVPILAEEAVCEPGQLVTRAEAGWECQSLPEEVGPHDHDDRYYGWAQLHTRQEIEGLFAQNVEPLAVELAEARADSESLGARLAALEERLAEVEAQVIPGICPTLFTPDGTEVRYARSELQADSRWIVCVHELSEGAWDHLVRVGDFWIDRYELSVVDGALLLQTGEDTSAVAASLSRVAPQGHMTWFQAALACANAGKRLCTNDEWQVAASGTPDPGPSSGEDGACVTERPQGPRASAGARSGLPEDDCVSRFGAEDMIGNVSEWVADWQVAGRGWQTSDAQLPSPGQGVSSGPWPPGYESDATWGVDGTAATYQFEWQQGLPAAVVRGGDASDGDSAGTFAFGVASAPSTESALMGARCCVDGR